MAGNSPASFLRRGKKGGKGQKIDPNDPNGALWRPLPEWAKVMMLKDGMYDFHAPKLDKFGAPYGIYCMMSGMVKYEQLMQQVENPEVTIENPYEAKLEELLQKGIEQAKAEFAKGEEGYRAKMARKASARKYQADGQAVSVPIPVQGMGKQKKWEAKHPEAVSADHASGQEAIVQKVVEQPKESPLKLEMAESAPDKKEVIPEPPTNQETDDGPATSSATKIIEDLMNSPEAKDIEKNLLGKWFKPQP